MEEKNTNTSANIFPSMEEEVLKFWEKADIFKKSIAKDAPRGDYVFYDGPPFATGTPHYGHIVGSIMKDLVPRFWTMRGYKVERVWGWDCHGLPIENIVEKKLGSKSKKDIEDAGVAKFNDLCRSQVLEYVDEWKKVIPRLGRWVDMEHPYSTMDLNFMESIWWVFSELYNKGLIYKGYRAMHICPRCETTLSQSEVSEGYRDVKDLSATVKFELADESGTFVLAWTTTPWTLIGNVALAVGADIDYVKIKIKESEDKLILAKERIADVLKEKEFEVLETLKGSELVGKKYIPVFDYYINDKKIENRENGWKIYSADFVTTEDGTGVVHIAPAFGEDDLNLGKENNLPFIQHIGMDGLIKKEAIDFAGLSVKPSDDHQKTDIEIIKYLAHKNLLFAKEKYEHSYPHCWRCDTPLVNYATSSWFVNITKMKEQMLELAKEINWSPDYIKEGRFGNWLEGARDWSISRQRFWASAIPIWECECGERKVIGSVEELEKLSGEKITDIHKHIVDEITFKCEKCQGVMKRIPDVFDCWFESGSMPYAQLHYPFENKEKFEANFPAQFIAEGIDQTRCWFYYLHAIATGVKNKPAYKNVIVNGIVLAEDGRKMSKKLKNYPDPNLIFEKYGADALRYYLATSPVVLAENLNFSEKGVEEALRKINMLLWNIVKFYEMFSGEVNNSNALDSKNILDQWILARLDQLTVLITKEMEAYNLQKASRAIDEFINDFSTWYIRRSRDRFKGEDEADKNAALATTRLVLIELSKLMAPFTPFIAESIWQRVIGHNFANDDKSVHLEAWPMPKNISNAENILSEMEAVRKIVELGLAKRDELGIKVRQPLQKLIINNSQLVISQELSELIKDELNIKEVISQEGKGDLSVELDTAISEELKIEGMKREIVRFINAMRKDAGLTIEDRVIIYYDTQSEDIKKVFETFGNDLMKDVLASEIKLGAENQAIKKEVKANGEAVVLGIEKI